MNHIQVWEAETAQPKGERAWLKWAADVEAIVGHNLDGDETEGDKYSIDGALAAFESGESVSSYAARIA